MITRKSTTMLITCMPSSKSWSPKKTAWTPPSAGKKKFFLMQSCRFTLTAAPSATLTDFQTFPCKIRWPAASSCGTSRTASPLPLTRSRKFSEVTSTAWPSSTHRTTRTPVAALSNNDVLPRDDAFNHRMFRYRWRSCPALQRYDKKIHPLALIDLFDGYVTDGDYVTTMALVH